MAGKWSSDCCEVKFFKDTQASTLAVDCIGIWALLAGRKSLAFVDLRDTDKPPVKVTRQSKWDIGCVQWNRHASHAHRFVTACNQRLDVFDFRDASASHLSSLKAHSRTVSDVDWSPFDVNIVASCSVDTFTFLWDVRDPKKPVKFFQTVSGAYQVKWNKVSNNLFATTHEGDVRIWDPRKENMPIEYISAHSSKIHGLDWSHTDQYKLVTASQDCMIRVWDYQNPRSSEAMMKSFNPVWRARYTPFGTGIVSVVVPQLRRGENSLYLWSRDNQQAPVHTFVGHQDVILEFQWRKQPEGTVDQQLVTWSKDQSLRIWRADPTLQKLCGHEMDDIPMGLEDLSPILHTTSSSSRHKIDRSKTSHSSGERTNAMGDSSVNMVPQKSLTSMGRQPVTKATTTNTNGGDREVIVNGHGTENILEKKEDRQSLLEKKYKVETVKLPLTHTAPSSSSSLTTSSPSPYPSSTTHLVPVFPDGRYQDNSVPFPRTCGATFSSNDFLVVFNVPSSMKKIYEENGTTPRSLSDLVRLTSGSHWKRPQHPPPSMFSIFGNPPSVAPSEGVSISDFFSEKHMKVKKYTSHHKSSHSHSHSHGHGRSWDGSDTKRDREKDMADRVKKRQQKVARVQVYNVAVISPISLYLARQYKLDLTDMRGCCEHNAKVANKLGRKDLVQMWTMILYMTQANQRMSTTVAPDECLPWASHPFGRALLEKYLEYYEKQRDVQTMAMLVCMFWDKETQSLEIMPRIPSNFHRSHSRLSFEASNFETLASSADSGWELLMNKGKRSRSFSESFDDFHTVEKDIAESEERDVFFNTDGESDRTLQNNQTKMLDPEHQSHYEQIKHSYANILYKWGLLNQRTQILKHTISLHADKKIEFSLQCSNCNDDSVLSVQCNRCKYPSLNCVICHVGVRGPANVCLACSHGGHSSHMMSWFRQNSYCPSGCGCNCLQEAAL